MQKLKFAFRPTRLNAKVKCKDFLGWVFLFFLFLILLIDKAMPLEVIGAGFGRTGTDSLRTALNILG
jgi:hypothetical protein